MYNVSTSLANALADQKLYMRVTYGDTTLDADRVTNCSYSASCGGGDNVTIGGVTSATVTLTIKGRVELLDQIVTVEVGALVSGTVQYIPIGTFVITDCQQGENSTTATGYDAAYCGMGVDYVPTVESGATVAAVLEDIAAQCSLTLGALPTTASSTAVTGDLTGRTCRDMAGLVAALIGRNVLIGRDGNLSLRWFVDSGIALTTDDYYDGGLSLNGDYVLSCIACTVTTKTTTTDEDGTVSESEESQTLSAGGTGTGISIENPYMTQSILDDVWTSIGGLAYKTGGCSLAGGLLMEPGDLIAVTDSSGTAHTIPVMSLALTIDGGCRATVSATGESSTNIGANFTGGLSGAIQQIVADVAKIKNLSSDNISAIKTKVENLYADNAWVENLFSQDITASGTISGLKLRGEGIDISSEYVYDVIWPEPDGESLYMGQQVATCALKTGFEIEGAAGHNYLNYWAQLKTTFVDMDGTTYNAEIAMEAGEVCLTGNSVRLQSETAITVNAPSTDELHKSFDSTQISSGTVLISQKMGWCAVTAIMTLSEAMGSSWVDVLDVPETQHGYNLYTTVPANNSTTINPLSARISSGGKLQLRYGGAGTYYFELVYPAGESYVPEDSDVAHAGTAIVGTSTVA